MLFCVFTRPDSQRQCHRIPGDLPEEFSAEESDGRDIAVAFEQHLTIDEDAVLILRGMGCMDEHSVAIRCKLVRDGWIDSCCD